jgi:hypothetical protein
VSPSHTRDRRPSHEVWVAVLLALSAAAACGHEGIGAADDSFRDRAFGSAIRRYREVSQVECEGGNSQLCCRALLGEADSLAGLNERQQAEQAYGRVRADCPYDLTVRRKLYLLQHPPEGDTDVPERAIAFPTEYKLSGLGLTTKLQWAAVFLDGEPIGHERSNALPGPHELEAEAFVEIGGRVIRARDRKPLVVPGRTPSYELVSSLRLALGAAGDGQAAEVRLELEVGDLVPAGDVKPPPPPAAGSVEEYAGQHAGFSLFESGDPPRLPREIVHRGEGWSTHVEICVAPEGHVERIKFLEASAVREPAVDAAILEAVRRWHYGRFLANGKLRGYCHAHILDLRRS